MKKIFKMFSSFILSLAMTFLFTNVALANDTNDINKDFMKLQNDITESMTIYNNKYIYDENEIKNIIDEANIDFDALNKSIHTSYNKESFNKIAINNIKNADLTPKFDVSDDGICLLSSYCGKNSTTGGWNYDRYFCSNSATKEWINKLNGLANAGIVGSVASNFIPGPGGTALSLAFTANGWYNSSLKDALISNNTRCGTVTDINKFTAVFTVVSQEKF